MSYTRPDEANTDASFFSMLFRQQKEPVQNTIVNNIGNVAKFCFWAISLGALGVAVRAQTNLSSIVFYSERTGLHYLLRASGNYFDQAPQAVRNCNGTVLQNFVRPLNDWVTINTIRQSSEDRHNTIKAIFYYFRESKSRDSILENCINTFLQEVYEHNKAVLLQIILPSVLGAFFLVCVLILLYGFRSNLSSFCTNLFSSPPNLFCSDKEEEESQTTKEEPQTIEVSSTPEWNKRVFLG